MNFFCKYQLQDILYTIFNTNIILVSYLLVGLIVFALPATGVTLLLVTLAMFTIWTYVLFEITLTS